MADYLAGRPQEALSNLQDIAGRFPQQLAAVYVRLGRLNDARSVIAEWRKANRRASIATEAFYWRMRSDLKSAFLDDLRAAGLPEQ